MRSTHVTDRQTVLPASVVFRHNLPAALHGPREACVDAARAQLMSTGPAGTLCSEQKISPSAYCSLSSLQEIGAASMRERHTADTDGTVHHASRTTARRETLALLTYVHVLRVSKCRPREEVRKRSNSRINTESYILKDNHHAMFVCTCYSSKQWVLSMQLRPKQEMSAMCIAHFLRQKKPRLPRHQHSISISLSVSEKSVSCRLMDDEHMRGAKV